MFPYGVSHPVSRFSDRDLFMRYRGGGVGHIATRQCNSALLSDKHALPGDVRDVDEIEPAGDESDDSEAAMSDGPGVEDEDKDEGATGDGLGDGPADEDENENDSDDEDAGEASENDDDLIIPGNDVDIVAAAGFAPL
jgi:hypothetical protein